MILRLFSVLSLALLAGSTRGHSILDIAKADDDTFGTLVTAIDAAGLQGAFDCHFFFKFWCRQLTVFAPTNDAFALLPADLVAQLTTNSEFKPHLRGLLLYHGLRGAVFADDIEEGNTNVRTIQGEDINVTKSTDGGITINGDAIVVTPDVDADNGVVHVIDKVLVPSFISNDIVEVASKAGSFTTLLEAATFAGIAEVLGGDGPFTLFAPSDAAFETAGYDIEALKELGADALGDILKYHVFSGIVTSDKLRAGLVRTVQGETADIHITYSWFHGTKAFINDAQIVNFDILASNGVIHVIDDVLIPPSIGSDSNPVTIAGLVAGNAFLGTLLEAVTVADLVDTLDDPDAKLTVLAPNDYAFQILLRRLGMTKEELFADTDLLRTVLTYHVLPKEVLSSELEDGLETTLESRPIDVDVRRMSVILNFNTWVIDEDNVASNGIVHVINKVLLPPEDIVETAVGTGFLKVLEAALNATDLVDTLKTGGPFTVFAPTDGAFERTLEGVGLSQDELLADTDRLRDILLYHVVSGYVPLRDLYEGAVPTLLEDEDGVAANVTVDFRIRHYFFRKELIVKIDEARVIRTNLLASNGIIHVIDDVLIPPGVL